MIIIVRSQVYGSRQTESGDAGQRKQCSPQVKFQGMTDWHTLGGACGYNKAYGLSLFPHQREFCPEVLLGQHASGMLVRTPVIGLGTLCSKIELLCYSPML